MEHYLKTDHDPFSAVWDSHKTFELRFAGDRDFRVGDALILRETVYTAQEMKAGQPLRYTGRKISTVISYIQRGSQYGLRDGYVALSFTSIIRERPVT